MATLTATIEDFSMRSAWTCKNGSMTVSPSQSTAYKTFYVSGLPDNSKINSVLYSVVLGSPLTGADVLKINGTDYPSNTRSVSQDVSSIVTGNGSFTFSYIFKAYGDSSMSDGEHYATLGFSNSTITIDYEKNVEPEPEPTPEVIVESSRLVCLFDKNAKKFTDNGLCVLNPISCVVRETAGGYYELEMEHPIDKYGKWAMIGNESIIRAPVPTNVIPEITLPAASVWRVKSSVTTTPLYTKLPTYTKSDKQIEKILSNPSIYTWDVSKTYYSGDYCVYNNKVYKSHSYMEAPSVSPANSSEWEYIINVSGSGQSGGSASGGSYDPGTVAENIPGGELITKIADYNPTYIQARSLRGIVGYVKRADFEETEETSQGQVIPSRTIVSQAFRVYNIECEDDTHTIKVLAKHISYDLQRNSLFDCQLVEAEPATAIAILQGSLISADDRVIACNISSEKISADWSFQNPVYALLDPDEGLLPFLNAKLIRDNADFFILDNSSPRQGPNITYGVNMRGVQWGRDTENVITRIVPRGGDGSDGYIYLDELFVDSPIIDEYAMPTIEILDCDCAIGQEVQHADGTKQTLTREDCLKIMREKAEKRFSVDKADAVTISLDVQFVLLGDTEEYKQYRNLQRLNLYDEIKINTGASGMTITAQVTGYEWDCLNRRYNEITIGNVSNAIRRSITGYRMHNGTITYSKLAPSLISRMKGNVS